MGNALKRARGGTHLVITTLRTDAISCLAAGAMVAVTLTILGVSFGWYALNYFGVVATALPRALEPWEDGTIPEAVEIVWTAATATLLLLAALRARAHHFAVWGVSIAVIAGDNVGRWHEQAGHLVARWAPTLSVGPLESHHLGEIIFLGTLGSILAVLLIVTYRRSPEMVKDSSAVMLVLVAFLGICAVAIDALHVATASKIVAYVEDGGEMLIVTALAIVAVTVARRAGADADAPEAT